MLEGGAKAPPVSRLRAFDASTFRQLDVSTLGHLAALRARPVQSSSLEWQAQVSLTFSALALAFVHARPRAKPKS